MSDKMTEALKAASNAIEQNTVSLVGVALEQVADSYILSMLLVILVKKGILSKEDLQFISDTAASLSNKEAVNTIQDRINPVLARID